MKRPPAGRYSGGYPRRVREDRASSPSGGPARRSFTRNGSTAGTPIVPDEAVTGTPYASQERITVSIVRGDHAMATCEVCGNDYEMAFEVITAGQRHVFDSFECAIHRLAPVCEHCGCRVIGHGVEADGRIFCCAHCSEQEGVTGLEDRV
jgi:hypothetical protein